MILHPVLGLATRLAASEQDSPEIGKDNTKAESNKEEQRGGITSALGRIVAAVLGRRKVRIAGAAIGSHVGHRGGGRAGGQGGARGRWRRRHDVAHDGRGEGRRCFYRLARHHPHPLGDGWV